MKNIVFLILNSETIWSIWNTEPAKITALATSINVLVSLLFGSLTLFIAWRNYKKDSTKVDVFVKRADNGPLILQNPKDEFILFEVYNKSFSSVIINEVGFKSKNKLINLVDLAYAYVDLQKDLKALGTVEGIGLPGTIAPKSKGLFLINYTRLKTSAFNYQQKSSLEKQILFGEKRVINTYQELENCFVSQTRSIQIVPYVITGSGECFIGKKSYVKMGNLVTTIE